MDVRLGFLFRLCVAVLVSLFISGAGTSLAASQSVTHFAIQDIGDNDGDGIFNYLDPDDDNDGVVDALDPAPFDPNITQLPDPAPTETETPTVVPTEPAEEQPTEPATEAPAPAETETPVTEEPGSAGAEPVDSGSGTDTSSSAPTVTNLPETGSGASHDGTSRLFLMIVTLMGLSATTFVSRRSRSRLA